MRRIIADILSNKLFEYLRKISKKDLLLLVTIIFSLAYFLIFFTGSPSKNQKTIFLKSSDQISNYLNNIKVKGFGAKTSTYEIHAKEAKQIADNKLLINNIFIKYFFEENKQNFISLESETGELYGSNKVVNFASNVEIIYSQGYRALTKYLLIDFNLNYISTNEKVAITGLKGKVFAEKGMHADLKQEIVYFKGPITSIFNNS